ncbi:hypothetical protein BYT27DRAFT_7187758 [Phlegmacium glaucopus]|nr:hypothetical protein BYT27DRAFT_7187758 [Phlegmacium glaucopus]
MGSADEIARERLLPLDVLIIRSGTSIALVTCLLHPSSHKCGNDMEIDLVNILWNVRRFRQVTPCFTPQIIFSCSRFESVSEVAPPTPIRPFSSSIPWLRTLLESGSSFSRPNAIAKIWIIYSLYLPVPYMDHSLKTTIFDKWADIDALLCGTGNIFELGQYGSHAYERLQEVKLECMLENPIGIGVAPGLLKGMDLDSPELEKRGILSINAFDTSG